MSTKTIRYDWTWTVRVPQDELWRRMADTDRFNRDVGLPSLLSAVDPEPQSSERDEPLYGEREITVKLFGLIKVVFVEEPFEWIAPHRFRVRRTYIGGPIRQVIVTMELEGKDADRTELRYRVEVRPRNPLGRLVAALQVGRSLRKGIEAALAEYEQSYGASASDTRVILPGGAMSQTTKRINTLAASGATSLPTGASDRLNTARKVAVQGGAEKPIVDAIAEWLATADDLSVQRLRPYAFADEHHYDRRRTLEAALHLTRAGALSLRWDLLCPSCRGVGETATSMEGLTGQVHCDSCRIDFRSDFERSVEITFRPNRAIRDSEDVSYCVGGPGRTPHILAQSRVGPISGEGISLLLSPGSIRVRPGIGAGQVLLTAIDPTDPATGSLENSALQPDEGGAVTVVYDGEQVRFDPPLPAGGEATVGVGELPLILRNETSDEQVMIVERTAWRDDAVTAREITTMQTWRDLFASESLRAGDRIEVGNVAILFTDLKGSTRLYREVGDAVAFGRVMAHFDVLRQAISDHRGAIVKTIGDAVMAIFAEPIDAIRAILGAQRTLADPPTDVGAPLTLRAGLHYGSCIGVTLNERFDYFGTTINLAARLEGLSTGEDIVVSDAVIQDPTVARFVQDTAAGAIRLETLDRARLKGFEDETIGLWRLGLDGAMDARETQSYLRRTGIWTASELARQRSQAETQLDTPR